jgi:hypothetical protein
MRPRTLGKTKRVGWLLPVSVIEELELETVRRAQKARRPVSVSEVARDALTLGLRQLAA